MPALFSDDSDNENWPNDDIASSVRSLASITHKGRVATHTQSAKKDEEERACMMDFFNAFQKCKISFADRNDTQSAAEQDAHMYKTILPVEACRSLVGNHVYAGQPHAVADSLGGKLHQVAQKA